MRALLRRTIPVLAATAVAVLAFVAVGSADGHVSVVEGNPSCTDLGYDFGYKIDMESFDGTYPIVVGGFDTGETVTASSDGTYVDWSSTLGMDAVKVKGGPNANLYTYDPESFGDTGLTAPNNVDSGGLYGVSHVEFCFDFELEVSKTANTSWERAYDWDLDKSVDDDGHIGWAGDSFTSNYDVDVSLEVTDQNWAIHGSIEIHNPSPFDVPFMVVDEIDGGVGPADVSCLTDTVPKGNTVTCTYTASPGGQYGTLNTATVTSYNPLVQGGEGTAPVIWGDPVVVGYDEVTVTDTLEGTLGTIGESTLFEYPKDFVCPTDPTMYTSGVYTTTVDNTAKITETGDEDSESVSLTCYLPTVTKTADASFDRDWTWEIDKAGSPLELLLQDGQIHTVDYSVTVTGTPADSNHAVSGTITVTNPSPTLALVGDLSDMLDDGTAATIDSCTGTGVSFVLGELTVPAGGSATCSYSAAPSDDSATENTAYLALDNATVSGSADVEWEMDETDECVTVTDDNLPSLSEVVCGDDLNGSNQWNYLYSLDFGAHPDADVVLECGYNEHPNTARFVTNDTGTTGSDTVTVIATVECNVGCTLTQGYWKTHSEFGPAPYDDTWAQLPSGASTPFFLSGQSYYQVFWTPPQGNAYYNLAHQWMAAYLNVLNGTSIPGNVADAWDDAKVLFETYTPADVADLKGKDKKMWTELASILDDYNNGYYGPGHCTE